MSFGEMEKAKIVEKLRNPRLGKAEIQEAYRGALRGNLERVGNELYVKIGIKIKTHTYMIQVRMTGDAIKNHENAIRTALESFELEGK